MKIWDGKLVFHFMPRNRERWSLNILLCTGFQVVLRLFRLDVGNALCDFDGRITSGFFNYKGGTPETPPPPVERRIKPGLNRVKQGSRLLNRKGHSCLGLGAIHLPKRSLSASNTPPPQHPLHHLLRAWYSCSRKKKTLLDAIESMCSFKPLLIPNISKAFSVILLYWGPELGCRRLIRCCIVIGRSRMQFQNQKMKVIQITLRASV